MSAVYETLTLAIESHVATLTLSRPDSRNALSARMCHELVSVLAALAGDERARVVVIRGAGPVFCAGADLKERQAMTDQDMTARRVAGFAAYAAIEQLPQPAIAVVHGAAFGSGCEIAAACDFILAAQGTQFCYPEVGWGTIGATQRLPRAVGRRMAKELLYTGRKFDAQEACDIGLVNHVYPAAELDAHAATMAARIAQATPLTVRLTKQCVDQGLATTREGAMAIELLAINENLRGTDWKGALAGFGAAQPGVADAG